MSGVVIRGAFLAFAVYAAASSQARCAPAPRPPALPLPTEQEVIAVEARAKSGDAAAQEKLANMYDHGLGERQDPALAVSWYLRAAKQGNAAAADRLAVLYGTGRGVPEDTSQSERWYRLAMKGLENARWVQRPHAASDLMEIYRAGGDRQNEARWLDICAEAGDSHCQHVLGESYLSGAALVPQDFRQAMKWLSRAADHVGGGRDLFLPLAEYEIGKMYEGGTGLARSYTKALQWYMRAEGYYAAEFAIAELYAHGQGAQQDLRTAREWYSKAADQGLPEADMALGALYLSGQGASPDSREALGRYIRAAVETTNPGSESVACSKVFAIFDGVRSALADDQLAFQRDIEDSKADDLHAQTRVVLSYICGRAVTRSVGLACALDDFIEKKHPHERMDGVHEVLVQRRCSNAAGNLLLLQGCVTDDDFLGALHCLIKYKPPLLPVMP